MKFKTLILSGVLAISLTFAAPAVLAQPAQVGPRAVADEGRDAFVDRVVELQKAGDWAEILRIGRARREALPQDDFGWLAEARASYQRGDIVTAVAAWEAAAKLGSQEEPKFREKVEESRRFLALYPDKTLKPFRFVEPDNVRENRPWQQQANALLTAGDYDGIERVAGELRAAGESNILGEPFLTAFFEALANADEEPEARRSAIEAWRVARPASDLARLVDIAFWADTIERERGPNVATKDTPQKRQNIADAAEQATQLIGQLPASAAQSPLMFVALQSWCRFASIDRPISDAIFREGIARFPDYQSIYTKRVAILRVQWMGKPGELGTMISARADEIGGDEGDIFYGLFFFDAFRGIRSWAEDSPYDYDRAWRGIELLRARHPDSATLRNIAFDLSNIERVVRHEEKNAERMRSVFLEPNSELLDNATGSFWDADKRHYYGTIRMQVLTSEDIK